MSTTILTDEQIIRILEENRPEYDGPDKAIAVSRAIEQAVLQSPEVQGLLNALQEVVDAADGDGWNVLDPSFEKQRAALAAMGN